MWIFEYSCTVVCYDTCRPTHAIDVYIDNVFICSTTEPMLPRLKRAPLRGCPDEPAAERNETSSIGPTTS